MGPFLCRDWLDIICFYYALKQMLDHGECIGMMDMLDKIHQSGSTDALCPGSCQSSAWECGTSSSSSSKLLKNPQYSSMTCLSITCFTACTVLTQLQIENGYPMYDIGNYYDPARSCHCISNKLYTLHHSINNNNNHTFWLTPSVSIQYVMDLDLF